MIPIRPPPGRRLIEGLNRALAGTDVKVVESRCWLSSPILRGESACRTDRGTRTCDVLSRLEQDVKGSR